MKAISLPKRKPTAQKQFKIELCLPSGVLLSDVFMDGQQVMQELFIGKRSLQNLRSKGKISHSKDLGKIFYLRQEIASLLLKGMNKRKP